MKRIIIFFILFLTNFTVFAQVNYEDRNSSGFVSLNIEVKAIDKKPAVFTGGNCGIIIKDIRLGVFFSGVTSKFKFNDANGSPHSLSCMQGGINIGYPIIKNKSLRPVADLKLSFGQASTINTNYERDNNMLFWGITPSIGLEYKISPLFTIELGINYQYSILYEPPDIYSKNFLNSFGAYISFKLGYFY